MKTSVHTHHGFPVASLTALEEIELKNINQSDGINKPNKELIVNNSTIIIIISFFIAGA